MGCSICGSSVQHYIQCVSTITSRRSVHALCQKCTDRQYRAFADPEFNLPGILTEVTYADYISWHGVRGIA